MNIYLIIESDAGTSPIRQTAWELAVPDGTPPADVVRDFVQTQGFPPNQTLAIIDAATAVRYKTVTRLVAA